MGCVCQLGVLGFLQAVAVTRQSLLKGCRPCRRPLTEETCQRSPLLSCWNFKKTTETDMILRCKGMCWEQCSQMCEAEWTHAVKSFMRGQTTASEPSLRFSCNSQLTLMLLSAVLYPKFEDISWDMWLFHSSDSSNHLPTERPSFCNWYGKYHPDTYEPDKGRLHLRN